MSHAAIEVCRGRYQRSGSCGPAADLYEHESNPTSRLLSSLRQTAPSLAVLRWSPLMTQKLLVVDDEPAILFALCDYFTVNGYQVDCAPDIERAKEFLGSAEYGVVIVDFSLSNRDGPTGLDLILWARERALTVPFIILTAYGTPELETASRSSAALVLHKPQPLGDLARIVNDLFGKR